MTGRYQIVQLASGAHSVRSLDFNETFHPVIGPVAEARALYVEQLGLPDRIRASREEFVVWDVGLGAAANPLTLLDALPPGDHRVRIVSFDATVQPLEFALGHPEKLPFLTAWRGPLDELLAKERVSFRTPSGAGVLWELHTGDFPSMLESAGAECWPKPHAIFYDAYSPATNAEMWTVGVFRAMYRLLDPRRGCAMPTYSRSTMLRTTLLLAGFFVGRGHATGEKEETTIAANRLELVQEPLDSNWLERVRRSTSAEPLSAPPYRQAPLSEESWRLLKQHPQFSTAKNY